LFLELTILVVSASQASRPETGSSISNSIEKTQVKEDSSYCDSSAGANLAFVADIGGLRFFLDRDVPDA
jgi:hypothetical protein